MIYLNCGGKDFDISEIARAVANEGEDAAMELIFAIEDNINSLDFTIRVTARLVEILRVHDFSVKLKIDGEKF